MLKKWFSNYFDNLLYIQINASVITLTDILGGTTLSEIPIIALQKDSRGNEIVAAIGADAQAFSHRPDVVVSNPFLHPRLLVANFQTAEKFLRHAVRRVCKSKLFPPSPRVVIHPQEKLEGGLTDIEIRVLRELCLGAGAREVVIYVGSPLLVQGFDFEQIKRQGLA